MIGTTSEEEQLARKLAGRIVASAMHDLSSDIHIEPHRDEAVVRFRVEGALQEVARHSAALGRLTTREIKKMCCVDPETDNIPQDGRMLLEVDERRVDVRVSTFPTAFGERLVMRIQDPARAMGGLSGLGVAAEDLRRLENLFFRSHGLVLISGQSGSGKTNTAYGALSTLVERGQGRHCILSLEEPIEAFLAGVNQTQVDSSCGLTYTQAIKGALRQDPDVLFCADIPNLSSLHQLLQAAITGHLVIAESNAPDAAAALNLLAEIGLESVQLHQLALVLQGLTCQRLARKLCEHCKTSAPLGKKMAKLLKDDLVGLERDAFFQGAGCDRCKQTGFRGRVPIYQIVECDEAVSQLLMERPGLRGMREELARLGHLTLRQSGMKCAGQGLTSVEEALRVTA